MYAIGTNLVVVVVEVASIAVVVLVLVLELASSIQYWMMGLVVGNCNRFPSAKHQHWRQQWLQVQPKRASVMWSKWYFYYFTCTNALCVANISINSIFIENKIFGVIIILTILIDLWKTVYCTLLKLMMLSNDFVCNAHHLLYQCARLAAWRMKPVNIRKFSEIKQ